MNKESVAPFPSSLPGYLFMDDVRQLLHHVLEVGLQALVILELVLLDDPLVNV